MFKHLQNRPSSTGSLFYLRTARSLIILTSSTHPTAHTVGGRAAGSDKRQMPVNITARFCSEDDDPNSLRSLRTSNFTLAFVFFALKYNGGNQHLKDSLPHLPETTAKCRVSFTIGFLNPLYDARPLLAYPALYDKSSDMIRHY